LPVRVRVKNFQSIEDAEILIDGFVVICGPNNSGKTALMRAIRGLFNNAAPGSYLRQGANFLSVEIEFDDGTTVLWEKGWEKPGKKGASINRYTLNGYQIASVGRGAPPEVEALGVKSILAGNNPIWPQVADQFDGTLFLVNKTGAVVAEALSDVERVGKLTDALRLSDKDKRSANSELKIRRDDLKGLQDEVKRFQGLDRVGRKLQGITVKKGEALKTKSSLEEAQGLQVRLGAAQGNWDTLKGYVVEVPPEPAGIRNRGPRIGATRQLRDRLKALQDTAGGLAGFYPPAISFSTAVSVRDSLAAHSGFAEKYRKLSLEHKALRNFQTPKFSDNPKLDRIPKVLTIVQGFKVRDSSLRKTLLEVGGEQETVTENIRQNEKLLQELLGERGYCPTCKTVHDGETHT